ncbi:PadR family transcriptional regulator [Corynebacterium sp. YIM 101645]|uniref:PadR family transcriptional regulator n=1 Tax=Corynebacterium lemuris TaxID=1859292 RepID=A0ABT2FW23_9CORY|nr:PadR family transcriptional regulator [Corynebacterium lemuris]MCS5479444.1 PadR family transcriptional regulator [Corynebacterium lemuris]
MSIKFSLLSLLEEQPRAVGQLRTVFEARTSATWPINVGQVYQTVQRLHRDGLITHHGTDTSGSGRSAEVYAVTDTGREVLAEWWSTPVLPPKDARQELVIKIAMAVTNPAINTPALILRQRQALMAALREATRQKAALPAAATADRLLLEHRIFELEAQGRWLDHIETLPAPDQETP